MQRPLTEEEKALVEEHLSYARKLANRFLLERPALVCVELDELYSVAVIGLCDAATRFDRSRTESFKTFSFLRVRGAMFDYLRKEAPMGFRKRGVTSENVSGEQDSEVQVKILPRTNEHELWTRAKEPIPAQKYNTVDESKLENPIYDPLVDIHGEMMIDPEETAITKSLAKYLVTKVDSLPERERNVLSGYYFDETSLRNLKQRCSGFSRSWLSRIHSKGLQLLRDNIQTDEQACEIRELIAYQYSKESYSVGRSGITGGE